MVDAYVSGAYVERRAGSSPVLGTVVAEIAQLVEHNLAKVRVASSSLVFRSFFFLNHFYTFAEIAQLVEHNLAKVRVASSSLVFRSSGEIGIVRFLFFYVFLYPLFWTLIYICACKTESIEWK